MLSHHYHTNTFVVIAPRIFATQTLQNCRTLHTTTSINSRESFREWTLPHCDQVGLSVLRVHSWTSKAAFSMSSGFCLVTAPGILALSCSLRIAGQQTVKFIVSIIMFKVRDLAMLSTPTCTALTVLVMALQLGITPCHLHHVFLSNVSWSF